MLQYTYTATGRKIRQQLIDREGRISTQRDYAGSFVYVNNDLAWVNTTHGRIFNKRHGSKGDGEYVKELHLRDHLGNTRATLTRQENLEYILTSQSDYYPFGLAVYDGVNHGDMALTQNRYLYNGKELQDDFGLNWYDYGARFYDPQIARWHSVDPLAEKYLQWSPYNYTLVNPIRYIDPDGRQVTGPYGMGLETASYEYYANMEWAQDIPRETSNMPNDINIGKQDAKAINQMLDGGAELNDVLDALGHGTVVLGIPLGVIEHFGGLEEFNNLLQSGKFETVWNRQTRQWSLNFHGNPSVSGNFVKEAKRIYVTNAANAVKDSRLLNLVKGGGQVLALTGGAVSIAQFSSGNIGAAEFTADMVFTLIAIKGGPGGWAVSSFYFVGKTSLDHPHDMRSNVGGYDFSNQQMRRSPHHVPKH